METNTRSRTCEVESAVAILSGVLDGLDSRDVPLPEATPLWELFSNAARLASTGKMALAERVREANEWKRSGYRTPEEWMAKKQGCSLGAARDQLAASKQLEELPDTAAALRSGAISPEQAVVVADAASVNPAAETDLIRQAQRDSHRGLRQEAARRKAQADPDPDAKAARHHRERRVWCYVDAEGRINIQGQGPVAASATFVARLERETDRLFRAALKAGSRESRDAYMFDALMALAGEPEVGGDGRPVRVAPKHLALIRVDLTALIRGTVTGEELCEISGSPISVREARALMGDSILHLVMTRGQTVRSITHLGRGPNAVQELALLWESQTCSVLGCSRTHTETDHRIEFATTKHTRLDELDKLCDHHHDLKTYQGWALVHGTGPRELVPPDHPRHPNNAPPPDVHEAVAPVPPPPPPPPAGGTPLPPHLLERRRRAKARAAAGSPDNNPEIAALLRKIKSSS